MAKLLMLSGLPASGKSTYAEELVLGGGNWVRVNRDLLRTMLHFDKWSGKNEDVTIASERIVVSGMLGYGKNVIVDDTNLSERHIQMWKEVSELPGVTFEHKHFDTDVWECIKRDDKRSKKVGRAVLMNMAMQYDLVPGLENIVVCDIDGTVADCNHRKHYLEKEPKDWKGFFSELHKDKRRWEVYKKARDLAVSNNGELIFVSARPEDYREETEKWLKDNFMDHTHLIMRRKGDKRPDTEIKEEIYQKYLAKYNIIKVFDDRPSVIEMWRSHGLEVVDCGDGIPF